MNTLVCVQPGTLEYAHAQPPLLTKDHAIIKIKRIGICGTDLHAYQGNQPFFNYPRILGHELSGDLIDMDGADGFVPGQPVTFIPYFNCGQCIACRNGLPNCCVQINVCGVHSDGGMAEYLSVPSYALVAGEALGYDELALVEPLAIGAHGVRRAAVREGEFVLVIGAGPIGLGTMEMARIAGAHVIALDVNEDRLRFCRDKLQVLHTVNATAGNVYEQLAHITNNDMPTVVIDATGNLQAINNGLEYLAHGGRFVLIGLQKEMFSFSHPAFHKREATLMSSRNATRADFMHVISCMKNGFINPTTYITHRVSFDALRDAFPGWLSPAAGVIKAMVSFP